MVTLLRVEDVGVEVEMEEVVKIVEVEKLKDEGRGGGVSGGGVNGGKNGGGGDGGGSV